MLQMCLLNCHMCGVAGQNYITCWEGLGIYSSVTQFRRARIRRNSAKLQNWPNITSSVGLTRVMYMVHQCEYSTFLVRWFKYITKIQNSSFVKIFSHHQ